MKNAARLFATVFALAVVAQLSTSANTVPATIRSPKPVIVSSGPGICPPPLTSCAFSSQTDSN